MSAELYASYEIFFNGSSSVFVCVNIVLSRFAYVFCIILSIINLINNMLKVLNSDMPILDYGTINSQLLTKLIQVAKLIKWRLTALK